MWMFETMKIFVQNAEDKLKDPQMKTFINNLVLVFGIRISFTVIVFQTKLVSAL